MYALQALSALLNSQTRIEKKNTIFIHGKIDSFFYRAFKLYIMFWN